MSGKKAPETAVYLLNGLHVRIKQGDVIPDGAELRGDPADAEPPVEPAPTAKKAAKVGPTETATTDGPDETS